MKKLSFYIKDFCIAKEADVAFIPPLVRRKLSTIDKFALTAFEKVYTPEVEEIVFASEFGEVERLNIIISCIFFKLVYKIIYKSFRRRFMYVYLYNLQ